MLELSSFIAHGIAVVFVKYESARVAIRSMLLVKLK